jgi:hypothetical protein
MMAEVAAHAASRVPLLLFWPVHVLLARYAPRPA